MDTTIYAGVSACNNNFIGMNKDTGQCFCVTGMDCDSGNGDTSILKTNGHYMFAHEDAPGLSACLFSVVASACVSNAATLCACEPNVACV